MYSNKRTPRTTPRSRAAFIPARPTPGRAAAVAARRRLNFLPTPVSTSTRLTKAKIGYTPGTGTSSRRNVINKWATATSSVNAKTLYSEDLTAIPRKTAAEVNARERDLVNLLGFTMRFCLSNTQQNRAAVVRMAVISSTDSNAVGVAEFFRGYADKRCDDFTATLDSSELLYNPINRDKYVVLWQKKIELGPVLDATTSSSATFSRTKDSYSMFQTYVPLNRQLRYVGSSGGDCTDKVFLVYWYDTPQAEGTSTPGNYVRIQRWACAHWKDP